MAVSLDATLAGPSSNSYVSVATADAYFANLLEFDAWDALSSDQKGRALISATEEIESLPFYGVEYDTATPQALKFPRIFEDYDGLSMPSEIVGAVCHLALDLHTKFTAAGTTGSRRQKLQQDGVTSFRLGELSESYKSTGIGHTTSAAGRLQNFPNKTVNLIMGWVRLGGPTESGRRYSRTKKLNYGLF